MISIYIQDNAKKKVHPDKFVMTLVLWKSYCMWLDVAAVMDLWW